MSPNESIKDNYLRLTEITNNLKFLGKAHSKEGMIRKIIRSIPRVK